MQQKENQSAPYQGRLKLKNPKEFNSDYIITYCIIGLFFLVATNILSPSLDMLMASSLSSIFGLSFSFVAYKQYHTKLQNKLKKLDELIINYKFNEIENLLENSDISLSHKSQFRIDIKDDNYWRMAKILFLRGVNIDFKDRNGRTPLMHLVLKKETNRINEILTKYGANPKIKDHDGNTALMYAIENKSLSIIKILLQSTDQYVNVVNNLGHNALMVGILENASISIIEYLLNNGADIDARNHNGDNAIKIATRIGNYKSISYLNKYIENQNLKHSLNQYPSNYSELETQTVNHYPIEKDKMGKVEVQPTTREYKEYKREIINFRKEERSEFFRKKLEEQQKEEDRREDGKLNKLKENWLLDKKESASELRGLIKSIVKFLPENLYNDTQKIHLKGSSLYKHYLSDDIPNLKPNDIDLELVSDKLFNNQSSQDLKKSICQLFSIKDDNYLQSFKVWRGERGADGDIKKEVWNVEFVLDKEQTGLELPLNIIIRNPRHYNPLEKDWVVSFDALRMILYEKDRIKLGECPKISVCSGIEVDINDLVEQLRGGKSLINKDNYNENKITKYIKNKLLADYFEPKSPSNDFKPIATNNLICNDNLLASKSL